MSRYAFVSPLGGGWDWCHSMNMADTDGGFTKYSVIWAGTTHSELGIFGGQGNTQADCGMVTGDQFENWVRKSFGYYSRTDSMTNEQPMSAITPNQPNGYTYTSTFTRGIRMGTPTFTARISGYRSADGCRGNTVNGGCSTSRVLCGFKLGVNDHRDFEWGSVLGGTTRLGRPDGLRDWGAMMMIYPTNRQLAFVFRRHNCAFQSTEVADFYYFVQRFEVAMQRAV